MARKLIKTVNVGRCAVKLYRDSEWNEYVVQTLTLRAGKLRVEGGKDGGAFESSKADARNTAAAQARRLRKLRGCKR